MAKIITIANQKGGVGKTTTAVNLAASIATAEHSVLLVDIDPQANASSGLGFNKDEVEKHIYHVLLGNAKTREAIIETPLDNLSLLPSGRDLIGAEIELIQETAREGRLADALEAVAGDYDFVFIDSPPSLGLLTLNALVACDSVMIPVQAEYYALEGVEELMHTVELVQRRLNPRMQLEGVLVTMADFRTNLARQVSEELRRVFEEKVYKTVINRTVRLSEAPSHGLPVILYDIASRGSENYLALAQEFLSAQTRSG